MKKIVIVDYGLGNLHSILQACKHFGYSPVLSANPQDILNADSLILPGVGAFEVATRQLKERDLINTIDKYVKTERPLMGVCLGMQLLFEKSHEFGDHVGLGYIKGEIKRFPDFYNDHKMKVPHIGWNKILKNNADWEASPLRDFSDGGMMYFVHSYYALPSDDSDILSTSVYNDLTFCSSVKRGNIFGFQAHPEKSGEEGLTIFENFLKWN